MAERDYGDYLESPEWWRRRNATIRRASYRCEYLVDGGIPCGEQATDVHHRTYARIFAESDGDLVALCREHHALIHGKLTHEQRRKLRAVEDAAFKRTYR